MKFENEEEKYIKAEKNENYICPFCGSSVASTSETEQTKKLFFNYEIEERFGNLQKNNFDLTKDVWSNVFNIYMRHCPSCNKVSFQAIGSNNLSGLKIPLYPTSLAKQFPDYIPRAIREDYEEAYSILSLSPKASATLSRRCLQGMIRDFWKVKPGKLYDEISAIKDKVPESQWKAIDSIRSLGNIGAHMEKDVNEIINIDDGESEKLIKLIELLIEKWYISRHDEEKLYADIFEIKEEKNEIKTKKES